jgi:hypothetical protein
MLSRGMRATGSNGGEQLLRASSIPGGKQVGSVRQTAGSHTDFYGRNCRISKLSGTALLSMASAWSSLQQDGS